VHANYVTDYDFAPNLNEYLASLEKSSVRSLEDLIKYNEEHATKALPEGKKFIKKHVMHNTYFVKDIQHRIC